MPQAHHEKPKMFSENFKPKSYDYYDYMDAWYFTFYFCHFDHSWFFHWGDEIKSQNDFPNWFQEWWLFFGATQDILCPQIKEGFSYFVEHGSHLLLTSCLRVMFFLSKFQIPWILCWDFVLLQMIPAAFPALLARKFKVKWWSRFTPSNTQQLPAIRQWRKCFFKIFCFKSSSPNSFRFFYSISNCVSF